MMGPARILFFSVVLQFAPTVSAAAQEVIKVFVPAFEAAEALGLNVATVLNLQLWQTLRQAPTPNPHGLWFGNAAVVWDNAPLAEPTHLAAERDPRVRFSRSQLVLWGKAYYYGDAVVVQPNLTLTVGVDLRQVRPEVWTVDVPIGKDTITLRSDVPARRYSFEPVVLDRQFVLKYADPGALRVFSDKEGGAQVGSVSGHIRALRHEGDYVRVRMPDGEEGWLHLPQLSGERSEVIDFVGGLVRLFRNDLSGAEALMLRAYQNQNIPTALKTDALLFLALISEKQGRSARDKLDEAAGLRPLSRAIAAALIMEAFADYGRLVGYDAPESLRAASIRRIAALLEEKAFLFADNDSWFEKAAGAYSALGREQ